MRPLQGLACKRRPRDLCTHSLHAMFGGSSLFSQCKPVLEVRFGSGEKLALSRLNRRINKILGGCRKEPA
jgi:hypothetical protein